MEGMVQEEMVKFRSLLENHENEPLDIAGKMNLPILNSLWRVAAGEHFEYDNPFLVDLLSRMTEMLQRSARPEALILMTFPSISKIWPSFLERDEDIRINRDMMNMMRKSIENHQQTFDQNNSRDFIDKYLTEIENTKDPNSSFFGKAGIENLASTLTDLFIAGSETTSTTLTWAVLYMVRNTEVQQKVQNEIGSAIG